MRNREIADAMRMPMPQVELEASNGRVTTGKYCMDSSTKILMDR
jgi:hypothetical protein